MLVWCLGQCKHLKGKSAYTILSTTKLFLMFSGYISKTLLKDGSNQNYLKAALCDRFADSPHLIECCSILSVSLDLFFIEVRTMAKVRFLKFYANNFSTKPLNKK